MGPNISKGNTKYVQNAEVDISWIKSIADIPALLFESANIFKR
jgi:hypothetical protein